MKIMKITQDYIKWNNSTCNTSNSSHCNSPSTQNTDSLNATRYYYDNVDVNLDLSREENPLMNLQNYG